MADDVPTNAEPPEAHAAADPEGDSTAEHEDAALQGPPERDEDAGPVTADAPASHVRLALIAGLVAVVALAALTGWLGWRFYDAQRGAALRAQFLEVGRQGALDLTTIDYRNVDAEVQRILDSATGTFYDDFQKRSQPFSEVVKQARSTSVGTVGEAGLLSSTADEAQVLVAVTVKTTNAGAPEQSPRAWRMRLTVEKIGDDVKISNVDFVA